MTTTMFTMNCSRHDIVLLPIPFTDLSSSKVRPAIVIGHGTYPGDLFVVPVTSKLANSDVLLKDWSAAGLNVPSGIKGQIFWCERSRAAFHPAMPTSSPCTCALGWVCSRTNAQGVSQSFCIV